MTDILLLIGILIEIILVVIEIFIMKRRDKNNFIESKNLAKELLKNMMDENSIH